MAVLYKNNAASTLASGINTTATSIVLASGGGAKFPAVTGSDFFYLTILDGGGNFEIVKVTVRTADTLTVVRAQEGTTALTFVSGVICELRITGGLLDQFKSDTATSITSSNVTNALGFTPYNASNPSGYITGITSGNVTTALGFTPYNATNPNGYISGITSANVTTALGYTPYNSSNPSGYITGITSGMVTTALGFTPYNNSNPSGYITSSALSGYLTSASAASTYLPLSGDSTRSGTTTLSGVTVFNNYISLNGDFYHNGNQYILNAAQNGWINTLSRNGGNPFINNVTYNGNVILHAGNYNSYALPLTGGTLSGTLGSARNDIQRILETYNTSAGSPTQFFIEHSYGGVNIGNARGNINISSGSLLHGGSQVLHAGNYTSYSPSLTGSGASGTWGISITGSANTANSASNSNTVGGLAPAQFFNNMGNNHSTYTDFNSVPGFGAYYVQQGTNSPTGVAANQWYGFTLGLGNQYSLVDYGTQIYWPRRAQNGDTYIYIRDREGGSWTSWTKIRAGYADTAGSATDSSKLPLSGGTMSGAISFQQPVGLNFANGQYIRDNGSGGLVIYSGAAVNINGTSVTINGNTALHAGNYTSYVNPKGGGWYGSGLPGTRWGGYSTSGGEISFGDGLPNAGQMGILADGCYVAAENNGFWSLASDNTWGSRRGMYWDGTYLNFTTNNATASFTNALIGGNQIFHAGNYTGFSGIFRALGAPSSSNDWNSLGNTYANSVIQVDPSNFSSTSNGPTAASYTYGTLLNFTTNSNSQSQIFISHAGNDLIFRGGWGGASWQTWNKVLTNQNYNSYSPTLTGGNASGTWGISVTGTAGSISGYNNPTTSVSANTIAYRDGAGDIAVRELVMTVGVQDFTPSSLVAIYPTTNQAVKVNASGARNFLDVPTRGGGNASGSWGISVTGASRYLAHTDGPRDLSDRSPSWAARSAIFDFVGAGSGNGAGNYAGVLTFCPWDGTSASTGDSSYQLAFGNESGVNASGMPRLSIRNGINSSWNGYHILLHSGNASNYVLPLSGGTLTGDLSIGNGGANTGLAIYHGAGAGDYGRIRFYQAGSNQQTIHIFPPAWQGASFAGGSAGSINLTGQNGVTFGNWNAPGMAVNNAGETWVRGNINLGYDAAHAIGRSFWAGGGGYPGYQYTGGNYRFGFSSTSGYIDVYTDGNFYAGIDLNGSNNLVLHAGNFTSYAASASHTQSVTTLSDRPDWFGGGAFIGGHSNANDWRNSGFYENGGGGSNWPSVTWYNSINVRHSNTGNYHGFQVTMSYYDNNLWFRSYQGAGTFQSWARALSNQNFAEYAINRGGDTVGGVIQFGINRNGRSGNTDTAALQAYSTGNNSAYMSFHKGGHYATNMGLDDDNVLRIGGWSAAANRWQLDMSGNGTYAGNVTAYSDERLKTNWQPMPEDYVTRLAQVKVGIYDRIDEKEMSQVGVSAQSLQRLLPQAIMTTKDEMQTLSVSYGNAALASSVELAKEVVDLRTRVSQLEFLINQLIGD